MSLPNGIYEENNSCDFSVEDMVSAGTDGIGAKRDAARQSALESRDAAN